MPEVENAGRWTLCPRGNHLVTIFVPLLRLGLIDVNEDLIDSGILSQTKMQSNQEAFVTSTCVEEFTFRRDPTVITTESTRHLQNLQWPNTYKTSLM